MEPAFISWEEGWARVREAIRMVIAAVDQGTPVRVTPEFYMGIYQTVYRMCIQKYTGNYGDQLFEGYKFEVHTYLNTKVLPSFLGKDNEVLLREFVKAWSNYRVVIKWLTHFLGYLECYNLRMSSTAPLSASAYEWFYDMVFQQLKSHIRFAATSMINLQRDGGQIDCDLLKNTVDVIYDIGDSSRNEFDQILIEDSAFYYSNKGVVWISEYSANDYVQKVEECLTNEKERLSQNLTNVCTKTCLELLQVVQKKLLSILEGQLTKRKPTDGHLSMQNHLDVNNLLLPMCATLSLYDGNPGQLPGHMMDGSS